MVKKTIYVGAGILIVLALIFMLRPNVTGHAALDAYEGQIDLYKSDSCGCCGIYSQYLTNKGGLDVNVVQINSPTDLDAKNEELGVPVALRTCHTSMIGGYFVEGHIPLDVINRLLEEKPDIAGIALPGMPSGSPGMPGPKQGEWVIYAVDHEGNYEEWMTL